MALLALLKKVVMYYRLFIHRHGTHREEGNFGFPV
jgi:hypothetical protein